MALERGLAAVADLIGKAVAVDPNYAEAYISLGRLLHEAAKINASISAYRRAIVVDLKREVAQVNLASALLAKRRPG